MGNHKKYRSAKIIFRTPVHFFACSFLSHFREGKRLLKKYGLKKGMVAVIFGTAFLSCFFTLLIMIISIPADVLAENVGRLLSLTAGIGIPFLLILLFCSLSFSRQAGFPLSDAAKTLENLAEELAASAGQDTVQLRRQRTDFPAASSGQSLLFVEQLSSAIRKNADNARQMKASRTEAIRSIKAATQSMKETSGAVSSIKAKSEEMGSIIRIIDDIAFQTNLLALNAAVEAARAGKSGAGFAVVAAEVRSLAQRSSLAAKNTEQLIDKNLKEILDGAELIEKTRTAFHDAVENNRRAGKMINEIPAASEEQEKSIAMLRNALSPTESIGHSLAAPLPPSVTDGKKRFISRLEELARHLLALVHGDQFRHISGSTGNDRLFRG